MPLIVNAPITDQTSQDRDLHVTVSNGLTRPIDNVTSETAVPAKAIEHPFYHQLYVFGFYVSVLTAAILIIAGIVRLWQQFSSGRDKARLNQLNDRIVAQDARSHRAQMAIVKADVKGRVHPASTVSEKAPVSEKAAPKNSGRRAAPRTTAKAVATKASTAKAAKTSSAKEVNEKTVSAKTQSKPAAKKSAEKSTTLAAANASGKGKSARVRTRAKKPAVAKAPPIVADTTPAPKPARRPSRAKPASA